MQWPNCGSALGFKQLNVDTRFPIRVAEDRRDDCSIYTCMFLKMLCKHCHVTLTYLSVFISASYITGCPILVVHIHECKQF